MSINPGEIFLAFNPCMNPPKNKYHICINNKTYLLVNTKPARHFNLEIKKEECSILKYDSNINCANPMTSPIISYFEPLEKVELSSSILAKISNTIKVATTIPPILQKEIVTDLTKIIEAKK